MSLSLSLSHDAHDWSEQPSIIIKQHGTDGTRISVQEEEWTRLYRHMRIVVVEEVRTYCTISCTRKRRRRRRDKTSRWPTN